MTSYFYSFIERKCPASSFNFQALTLYVNDMAIFIIYRKLITKLLNI